MSLVEAYYEQEKDGRIGKHYTYRGKEPATMSDVYEYYLKGNIYTDSCATKCKVAIGISIVSIITSLGCVIATII